MAKPLWTPGKERIKNANITKFIDYVNREYGLALSGYDALYEWSVDDIPAFWEAVWKFSGIVSSTPYREVMGRPKMPGTEWFKGAKLNFAENLLKRNDGATALISVAEGGAVRKRVTFEELNHDVARLAKFLADSGVKRGDRVAGFLPNIAETVIAMLAATSLGAVWSSCSPDFGFKGVMDRFGQIEPKILFTADGYTYNGKNFDSLERVREVVGSIKSIEKVVVIPMISKTPDISAVPKAVAWGDALKNKARKIKFAQVPFNHPLYIMYSSGTTGVPKCIVHGVGGTLLQQVKEMILHTDMKENDLLFYFTTCGWMMWNWLVSALAVGSGIVLYDGSPAFPDTKVLWKMAENLGVTVFGTSPKFLSICEKDGVAPGKEMNLKRLKAILSTGSPLSVDNFAWVYKAVKEDVCLASISGGTDIISCFMLGSPISPVYAGEIQKRGLGMKIEAWNDQGKPVVGEKGELVCTAPFVSMPVGFLNDPGGKKYHEAYFDYYKGVWRHGDYIEVTKNGGVIVYGRSDATLNPGGVRIGTAEIYRQVEALDEVLDSVVVGQNYDDDVRVILFLVLRPGLTLTDELKARIVKQIRVNTTPRHVPAKIIQVKDVPRTISGKKVEIAVTKMIHNEEIKNKDALANPEALEYFRDLKELK